jgi:hypothetical protein
MTDASPDLLTAETFTPLIGQEFSILHPQVPTEFKLRLTTAYEMRRRRRPSRTGLPHRPRKRPQMAIK